jgi:hypothetical protein
MFDGTRTRFVAVNADGEATTGVGTVDGRFVSYSRVTDGWLSGWLGHSAAAVNIRNPEAVQVVNDRKVNELHGNDAAFATVAENGERSTIRIYPRR